MAKCSRCGKSVGFFSNMCDDCKQAVIVEQKAERERLERDNEKRTQMKLEEYQACKDDIISARIQLLRQRIECGEKVFLYESMYLPVDSKVVNETITEEFSIGSLRRLGFDGWDIVAVIPRTLGVALTNESYGSSSGTTWGAGLGGNVVGVHIVIKKELLSQSNISDDFLAEYFDRNLFDFVTEEETRTLRRLLNAI
ncbi:MAG: hypothetical protein QG641_1644 [Candidatus Poribacteria bacterium]|nr:hypothetical protein [Candidatus Poribacteria bacterium]